MSLVVDASVLVEILLKTPLGRAAVGRLADQDVSSPDILDSEVAQALRRACRRGGLDDDELRATIEVLADWPVARVPTRHLVLGSRRWWRSVSVYDSLYLAVAVSRGAHLLACDGPLSRAPGTGVLIENLRLT